MYWYVECRLEAELAGCFGVLKHPKIRRGNNMLISVLSDFVPSPTIGAGGIKQSGCPASVRMCVIVGVSVCVSMRPFLPSCMQCRRGLAMRKLSVRPSVKRVNCDNTEERSVQSFIPYERSLSLDF